MAAQERLSLLHSVENSFTIGKNKVIFKLNGSDVFIYKHKEKTTDAVKTTVECDYCFPLVLYQNEKEMFTEHDLEQMVVRLDRYFINEVIGKSPKLALCNPYHYVKTGLLPFFEELDDAEEFILYYMAHEADCEESMNSALPDKNSILFLFLADAAAGQKLVVVDVDDFELRISLYDYDDGIILDPDQDDDTIAEFVFPYSETPDLALAVSTVLEGLSNIRMQNAELEPYVAPEIPQEEEDL